jgi:hypothetical protein
MQTPTRPIDDSNHPADPRRVLEGMAALIASFEGEDGQALAKVLRLTLATLGGRFAVYHRFDSVQGRILVEQGERLPEDFRFSGPLAGSICYEELVAAGNSQVFLSDLRVTVYPDNDPDEP